MASITSSHWIQQFEKLFFRRQHIILYGNIQDLLLWRDSYHKLDEFLPSYFVDKQFDLVFSYDPIEGEWNFANPKMRSKFDKLAKNCDYIETDSDLEENFCQILGTLSQAETSVAAILNLGDLLISNSIQSQRGDRNPLILLKKCTLEASIINTLSGYRNTLIILLSDLKGLPEWVYQNNPFLGMVEIPLPDKGDRLQYALRYLRGFYQGDKITSHPNSQELELLAEEFADLTAGFKIWDLDALRHTSLQRQIPLETQKIWRLVDFYKFGLRDDPWEKLNSVKVLQAKDNLSREVIGQNYAVDTVTSMLTSAKVGISMSGNNSSGGKPKGIFFFVGPTGVGKTELAKAVTKLVFGDESAFARFDMSEYKQEQAAEKLTGAPPGFVGYEQGGLLTNRVLQQPYSIILFDEIEKANPKILDKFLQILEDGRLTDGKGQTAYFNQTVIIFTSNIGASDFANSGGNIIRSGIMHKVQKSNADEFNYQQVQEHFRREVEWYFTTQIGRAELLSRLGDNIVVFDILRPQFVQDIGQKFLHKLADAAKDKYQLNLNFLPTVLEKLSKEMDKDNNLLLGGRRIKTLLESLVERPLNSWIFNNFPDSDNLRGIILDVGIDNNGLLVRKKE